MSSTFSAAQRIRLPLANSFRKDCTELAHKSGCSGQLARMTHGPKRCRYSPELMKALTISAFWKLPLN